MGIEDFGNPVSPPEPEEEKKPEEINPQKSESLNNLELTVEEIGVITGKKDSILVKRGINISVKYAQELLALGVQVLDKNDLESVADAILAKHIEIKGNNKVEALTPDEIKKNKLAVEKYIETYGFEDARSAELMEEWIVQSLRAVTAENTVRANIIHNLRVMDLLRVGGKIEEATNAAREAYYLALKDGHDDIVNDILIEYPDFSQLTIDTEKDSEGNHYLVSRKANE
jgi:hypothetical protein